MDCCSSAEVNCSAYLYNSYAGGIVGYQGYSTLLRCRNSSQINSYDVNGSSYAGACRVSCIIGTITECYNTGSVTSSSTSHITPFNNYASDTSIAGGLVDRSVVVISWILTTQDRLLPLVKLSLTPVALLGIPALHILRDVIR